MTRSSRARCSRPSFPGAPSPTSTPGRRSAPSSSPGANSDLILADYSLPGFTGLEALAIARRHAPSFPFGFLYRSIGEEGAIAALRGGAYDYVLKHNMVRLPVVVRHALDDFDRRRNTAANQRRLLELADIIKRGGGGHRCQRHGRPHHPLERRRRPPLRRQRGRGQGQGDGGGDIPRAGSFARVRDAREATLEGGEFRKELAVTTRDGREIVIEAHMSLVRDAAGRPTARLTIATDITEKKRLEEQVLRAQRVETLGMLAAGIAHDLNNVLTPVDMVASMLRLRVTDPEDLQMLDILENSAKRGTGLVRQILGFARGAAGGVQLTQITHLLRDVVEIVRASFPKSIVCVQEVGKDLPPIQANPTQVHQVLLNLAVNARDAMLPRGGTLTLGAETRVLDEAAAAGIEGARPGEFLVLRVADTGSGMSPEVLARMWEPFFTTKGEGKGTGLGLSTVRGIAAAHGGFVTVESRVGAGTTFRVFLPAAKPGGDGAPSAG